MIFLAGAFGMVATEVLPAGEAYSALTANLPVIVFLFALFILVAGLEQAGALEHIARWVVGRAQSPADLPFVLFVTLGVFSAFIVNDALVLVGVPLLLGVARRLRVSARPLLLTLAFSVTVGSVLTPLGNPQNLLVSLGSGLGSPISTFFRYLLLPTAVNLLVGGLYVRHVFGVGLSREAGQREPLPGIAFFPPATWGTLVWRFPSLVIFPVTVIAMIVLDVLSAIVGGPNVPLYLVALGGAVVALILSPGRTGLFARVDWSILVLFASLFVVVAGVVNGGVLAAIEASLPIPGPSHATALPAIILTSLVGSQLVSNVPWVALQIPVLHALGYGTATPWAWVALAASSTLAGNVTLLGAASNLIVVQQAERAGVRIDLREFARIGIPLAAITVLVLSSFLWVGL